LHIENYVDYFLNGFPLWNIIEIRTVNFFERFCIFNIFLRERICTLNNYEKKSP
jgi:hypothetical protein